MKVLVTPTSFQRSERSAAYVKLLAGCREIVWNPCRRPLAASELPALLDGVDGWIAGLDSIDASVIHAAPASLKVISRYGVGVERVDLKAAGERGIVVTNTPGANTEAVADLTFGLMLSVARQIPRLNSEVRAGGWPRFTGVELFGKTLGLIGFGAIGKSVARRAAGFSMKVMAHDPWKTPDDCRREGVLPVDLDTVVSQSDILSLHLPRTPQTENLLDSDRVAYMKPGAILINTSRGGLVDELALMKALEEGRLFGVGLDAFAVEPPGEHPLLRLPQVVATPHAGAHTREAAEKMAELAVDNLLAVLTGQPCLHCVTAG